MKKGFLIIKISSLISFLTFLGLILALNFILIPQTFSGITQIIVQEKNDNKFLVIIDVSEEQKNAINQRIIDINFIEKKSNLEIIANNWMVNQLVILETHYYDVYKNQKIIVSYGYESLLTCIFKNIS